MTCFLQSFQRFTKFTWMLLTNGTRKLGFLRYNNQLNWQFYSVPSKMPKCHRHTNYTYHHRYGGKPGANSDPAIDFTEALFPWYFNCGCTSMMRRPENYPTVYSMCRNESPWGPCGLIVMLLSVYMIPSSNVNIFRVTDPLCEEFTGGILAQRSGTQSFIVHTHMSEQTRRQRFETPSGSLWRHCNDMSRGSHCMCLDATGHYISEWKLCED